jgi:selenide, water dikinase
MPTPALPGTVALGLRDVLGDAPLCGGCGAKVGRAALRQILGDVPGDDAAILQTGMALQVISTDHLRAVTQDPVLMARIAAVHALGDIWAMGASPQAATATIILPRMSSALQRRTLAEIMAVATEVMTQAGASIVGGHTSLGAELTLGFTVTGLCARAPITLAGARDGDAIILTKPLGSGVILAGAMQGRTKGADLAACFAAMVQGQAAASTLLRDAHAMTDVTGFGLAGHLMGICEASGVGADLTLATIPLLQGAEGLAQNGVRSSIWADNKASAGAIAAPDGARSDLLFDPQTAGGLLAAVDPAQAPAVLAALQAAGYPAAIIGTFRNGSAAINAAN